jgi:hypothetical protein
MPANIVDVKTIYRDVCIIGGGVTGTFAAIRLRDKGKSVALIERENRLGGHTLTYQDPGTGRKAEAGVVVIRNSSVSHEFFSRFGIPLTKFDPPPPTSTMYVDFETGRQVEIHPSDPSTAFAAYGAELEKYPFLDNGFDLPMPVPPDLLLPFGKFVKKYQLSPIVPLAFKLCQGFGNILHQPTLYIMKNFGSTALEGMKNGFFVPETGDNSEIFQKAGDELGADVYLSSDVEYTKRTDSYVKVMVRTPAGPILIQAKTLLVTVPPLLNNLQCFDLTSTERDLFGQFSNGAFWTALLRNTGIPNNTCLINANLNNQEALPTLPGIYEITPTGIPELFNLKYGSPGTVAVEKVLADILSGLNRLQMVGTLPTTPPNIVQVTSHTPFGLTVPVSAVKSGFYNRLNDLNGQASTFYTGATFQAHDVSLLWEYTDRILDGILARKLAT